jgi:thiol-disulfide isomerase/thioredoxin
MHRTAVAVFLALLVRGLVSPKDCVAEGESDLKTGTIVVHVVNEAGAPQLDATASLFRYDRDWRQWKDLGRENWTNEAGVVRYDELPAEGNIVVRATSGDHLAGYKLCLLTDDALRQDVELKVEQQRETAVRVHDQSGKPVAGARVWSITHRGRNGTIKLDWDALPAFGLSVEESDAQGQMQLPDLPPGTIELRLIHPDFAPCEVNDVQIGQQAVADATLQAGVKVTLRIESDTRDADLDSITIDLIHDPYRHPSTLFGRFPGLRPDGTAELTIAAGQYEQLRLKHPKLVITPAYAERYGHGLADQTETIELGPGPNIFTFHLQPKVKVRGRVIDALSGKPLADKTVKGSLHAKSDDGPLSHFVDEWTNVDGADTNERGEYDLQLAAGHARISFEGQGLVASPDHYELDVAADGSTVVPDFLVRPLPKILGVVRDASGKPVAKAVVRFRSSLLAVAVEPVATDDEGHFELAPPWIPEDFQTHEKLTSQRIVAFHPYEPTDAQAEVRLDDPNSQSNLELQLAPRETDLLSPTFSDDFSPWSRGVVPEDERQRLAAISLAGKPAPELDGAQWLNTEGHNRKLADFRGKIVLLQFWTTWCGPCHQDMPAVKLLYELYGDKVLVVIGIHDNSMPLDAIQADVVKQQLTYPIVIDQPDGRIIASYRSHGISGYPSYVLIGPDGNVLKDDATIAGPTLRSFKLEIVRQLLMADQKASH